MEIIPVLSLSVITGATTAVTKLLTIVICQTSDLHPGAFYCADCLSLHIHALSNKQTILICLTSTKTFQRNCISLSSRL